MGLVCGLVFGGFRIWDFGLGFWLRVSRVLGWV